MNTLSPVVQLDPAVRLDLLVRQSPRTQNKREHEYMIKLDYKTAKFKSTIDNQQSPAEGSNTSRISVFSFSAFKTTVAKLRVPSPQGGIPRNLGWISTRAQRHLSETA